MARLLSLEIIPERASGSVDYIRNVQTHYLLGIDLLGIDENHAGDIRYFNKTGALDAIAATNTKLGVLPLREPASTVRFQV